MERGSAWSRQWVGVADANWCEMRGKAGWIGNAVLIADPARSLGRKRAFAGHFEIQLYQAPRPRLLPLGGCPASCNRRGRRPV
jgi:hypothetical protein